MWIISRTKCSWGILNDLLCTLTRKTKLRFTCDTGDFKNQNATQPETSSQVICSQSASLRMHGAKLQRVFFTFRTRGWHLQRFQKTWVVSTVFDLELNFLLLPFRQNCFSKSMKMLFIVKKYQANILICLFYCRSIGYRYGEHADPPSSIPKSKTGK